MTINPLSSVSQMLLSGITNHRTSPLSQTGSANTRVKDQSQLSPFAQLMSTLQQLQQSNPAQYEQVSATLASNLQQAALNAQGDGNSGEANALNQLAASFTKASQTGQLPTFMQQGTHNASGPHHHHPGGGHGLGQDLNSISQTILAGLDSSGATSTGSGTTPQR
jgi:hypothetical protein